MFERKEVDLLERKKLSGKELEAAVEAMQGEEIDTKEFSDVVIHSSLFFNFGQNDEALEKKLKKDRYLNLMTGRSGDLKTVRNKNGNNICITISDEYDISIIRGLCVVPSKTLNALIIAIFVLQRFEKRNGFAYKWVEEKENRRFVSTEYVLDKKSAPVKWTWISGTGFDFQTVDVFTQDKPLELYDGAYTIGEHSQWRTMKTLLDYFGGFILRQRGEAYAIHRFETEDAIVGSLNIALDSDVMDYDDMMSTKIIKCGNVGNLGPANRTAINRMVKIVKAEIAYNQAIGEMGFNWENYDESCVTLLSYLHAVDGGYVERSFYPVVAGENDEVVLVEMMQVRVDTKNYPRTNEEEGYARNGIFKGKPNIFHCVPVYREKAETESAFGIAAKYTVDNFISYQQKYLRRLGKDTENNFFKVERTFTYDYCSPSKMVNYAVFMAQDGIVEKLLKLDCMTKDAADYIMRGMLWASPYDTSAALIQMFGQIDREGKTIDKILMLPNGMFSFVVKERISMDTIEACKTIFSFDEESSQYFLRLDEKSYQSIAEHVDKYNYAGVSAFRTLNKLFGYKNWKGHMAHLEKKGLDISLYTEYLGYVESLSGATETKYDWKVIGQSLDKAIHIARQLHMMLNDTERVRWAEDSFKESCENWKGLEWEDKDYMVIAPENPYDIVEEGMSLRHCAKEFVEPIAKKMTTIMFIRRKNNPDKPFFTLEIRTDSIRQCHGFDNKNVDDKVAAFLKKYASEKNLSLDIESTKRLLGAG